MTRRTILALLLVAAALAVGAAAMLARTDGGARRARARVPVNADARTEGDRGPAPVAPDDAAAPPPAGRPAEEPADDAQAREPASYPPDPVEIGPCALLLRAVDVDSGEAVEARVDLWRLDAPGNEHWTDGDQRQASVTVTRDGTLVEDLPAGRYRLSVLSQPALATDPEPFHVAGARTESTFPVRVPRSFEVRVRLLDAAGNPLREARRLSTRRGWTAHTPSPAWRRARRPREPLDYAVGAGGGASMGSFGRRTVRADANGILVVGTVPERTRDRTWRMGTSFEVAGHLDVRLEARDPQGDLLLEAVCVPDRGYEGVVRMPDGSDAAQAGADVSLWIEAVAVDPAHPPGSARDQPIHLRAIRKGYETIEAEFPRDAPPPAFVMEPDETG